MKTFKIALGFLIYFFGSNLYGQDESKINPDQSITLSFNDPSPVRSYREILNGTNAQVIINDVNKLIYKCEFVEIQKRYRSESENGRPTVLEARTQDLSTVSIVRTGNSLVSNPDSSNNKNSFDKKTKRVEELQIELQKSRNAFSIEQRHRESLDQEFAKSSGKLDSIYISGVIIKGEEEVKEYSRKNYLRIDTLELKVLEIKSKLGKALDSLESVSDLAGKVELKWKEFRKSERALNQLIVLHNDLKNELLRTNSRVFINDKFKNRIREFYQENPVQDRSLGSVERHLLDILNSLENSLITLEKDADGKSAVLQESIKELRTAIKEVNNKLLPVVKTAVKGIDEMCLWIADENNFRCIITTNFLRSDVDALTLDISIKPKEELKGIGLRSFNQSMEFRARGGIKIDFSAGLALNAGFIDDFTVLEDDYELSALSDTTTLLRATDNEDVLSPAAIAMANFYIRKPGDVNFGLSVGAGTDLKTVSYYLGASLLFGREDVLVFTTGVTLAQRRELKSEYRSALNDNEGVLEVPVGSLVEAELYSDRDPYRMGLFFGFTYNFTAHKEKQWKENFVRNSD